eukprot:COSAG02_NODE_1882_length_10539_cov_56.252203_10_plen_75_part_00
MPGKLVYERRCVDHTRVFGGRTRTYRSSFIGTIQPVRDDCRILSAGGLRESPNRPAARNTPAGAAPEKKEAVNR